MLVSVIWHSNRARKSRDNDVIRSFFLETLQLILTNWDFKVLESAVEFHFHEFTKTSKIKKFIKVLPTTFLHCQIPLKASLNVLFLVFFLFFFFRFSLKKKKILKAQKMRYNFLQHYHQSHSKIKVILW